MAVRPRADSLTHGLVEQRGDDAAMQVSGMTLEGCGNCGHRNHTVVLGKKEFEAQAGGVGRTASETAVLGGVREWREVRVGLCHPSPYYIFPANTSW